MPQGVETLTALAPIRQLCPACRINGIAVNPWDSGTYLPANAIRRHSTANSLSRIPHHYHFTLFFISLDISHVLVFSHPSGGPKAVSTLRLATIVD